MEHILETLQQEGRHTLLEHEAKSLLDDYDIPVPEHRVVTEKREAVAASRDIGFPVVMKVVSPDLLHKSDVGGVEVGVQSPSDVGENYDRLIDRVGSRQTSADIRGVLIEEMVVGEHEVIIGIDDNRNFGHVIMAGYGGVAVELFDDVAFRLPTLDRTGAKSMLESLRSYPLLTGYRGNPPTDVEAVVDLLVNLAGEDGLLAAIGDYIDEIDLNPVIIREQGEGCVAVDALVTLSTLKYQ